MTAVGHIGDDDLAVRGCSGGSVVIVSVCLPDTGNEKCVAIWRKSQTVV